VEWQVMSDFSEPYKISILLDQVNYIGWEKSEIRGTNRTLLWLPVAQIFAETYRIGFSIDSYWVIEIENYISVLSSDASMLRLFPCLKKTYQEFVILIEKGLSQKNLPSELSSTFPYKRLIINALRSGSDFWTSLALDWLTDLNVNEDEDFIIELKVLSVAMWLTQETKQKANKLFKKRNR
jgi:hypothetical protein